MTLQPPPCSWRDQVVFAYIDEPPFASPGPGGQPIGCDVDLAFTVLRAIGVRRVQAQLTTFSELLPGVADGRWTVATPLFVTPARSASVAFSRPVWALGDGFIVRSESAQALASYQAIAAAGARLGVVAGQVQRESALAAGVAADRITLFDTQAAVVAALLAGRVDAYASTALGNRTFTTALGNPALAAVAAPAGANPPVGAFSFARHEAQLRERFDAFLAGYLGGADHRARMAALGMGASEIDPVIGR
jgi:polar amino acid transport system substrate-binding protein